MPSYAYGLNEVRFAAHAYLQAYCREPGEPREAFGKMGVFSTCSRDVTREERDEAVRFVGV